MYRYILLRNGSGKFEITDETHSCLYHVGRNIRECIAYLLNRSVTKNFEVSYKNRIVYRSKVYIEVD